MENLPEIYRQKKQRCIGANEIFGTNAISKTGRKSVPGKAFDSPVIYGVRVETSNPYHLLYIENSLINFIVLD